VDWSALSPVSSRVASVRALSDLFEQPDADDRVKGKQFESTSASGS
jgi:hypothetical protein